MIFVYHSEERQCLHSRKCILLCQNVDHPVTIITVIVGVSIYCSKLLVFSMIMSILVIALCLES